MAIDTVNKRRTALNRRIRGLGHYSVPDGAIDTANNRRSALDMWGGGASNAAQTIFLFDVRVFKKAISESGGQAVDSTNLGTISYVFDDMLNNDGKVQLPFG